MEFDERPWGNYLVLEDKPKHKVKRITVYPKKRLSLQRHKLRQEHWYIICGKAEVTLEGKKIILTKNQAIDIARGIENRTENRTEKTYSRLKFGRRASCFLALGFLALGFLTTGFFALNLQAQDAEDPRKKGFFVGIAPYTMGVTLEKEVKVAEFNSTVIDVEYDATFGPGLLESERTKDDHRFAPFAFIELCKGGYTPSVTTQAFSSTGDAVIETEFTEKPEFRLEIQQFIVGGEGIDFDNFPAEDGDISYATESDRIFNAARCKAHFDRQLITPSSPTSSAPGTAEKTEEQMSGTGIAFGYNLEKWGLSFSHYNLGAGDNKLQSQVLYHKSSISITCFVKNHTI